MFSAVVRQMFLFNGKPKATAFWEFRQLDDADAFGLPLNNLMAR